MATQIRQATIASAVYSTTAMPAKTGAIAMIAGIAMTATMPNGVAWIAWVVWIGRVVRVEGIVKAAYWAQRVPRPTGTRLVRTG